MTIPTYQKRFQSQEIAVISFISLYLSNPSINQSINGMFSLIDRP